MNIVFITDGGVKMGMGHVYRAISIADEIKSRGNIYFLTKSEESVVKKIEESGFHVTKVKNYKEVDSVVKLKPNIIIIDRLFIGKLFVKKLRKETKAKIIIFDNVSEANRYAHVVVNALVGSDLKNRKIMDKYAGTLYFYGPRYLFLRKEFQEIKKRARKKQGEIKRVLLLFGGSDPSNFTSKVLNRILELNKKLRIDVAMGPLFKYREEVNKVLEKYPYAKRNVTLLEDVKNIANLMHNSHLIITSPGLSMFEALYIGKPVIAIPQNSLQKRIYQDFFPLANNRDIKNLDISHDSPFIIYPEAYQEMHIGEGKIEVIEAIMDFDSIHREKKVSLRQATDDDLEIMMAWRSNPMVYRYFYLQNEPLKWEGHYNWWKSRKNRIDWIIMFHEGERPRMVGSVNASLLDSESPEIGIFIGEVTLWGKGVAKAAVMLVMKKLKRMGYKKAKARIMKENMRSIKLFEGLGFRRRGEGREGEWEYEVKL